MADIKISLEYNSSKLIFPINPSELRVSIDSSSETLNVIGLGEVSIPTTPKLATLTIASFFWNKVGMEVDSEIEPDKYVTWIKEWQISRKPAHLVVTGLSNFTMRVTCEKFWHEKRAGEEGSIYFELALKEYRDYGAKKVTAEEKDEFVTSVYQMSENRADNLEVPKEVTVTEDANPVAIGRSNGSDGLEVSLDNKESYDVESGEFIEGSTIKLPEKSNSSEEAREKAIQRFESETPWYMEEKPWYMA